LLLRTRFHLLRLEMVMAKDTIEINIINTSLKRGDIIRNQKPGITLSSLGIRALTKAWLAVSLAAFWVTKLVTETRLLPDLALLLALTLATGSLEGANPICLRNTKGICL